MSQEATPGGRPQAEQSSTKMLIDYSPVIPFLVTYFVAERLQPGEGIYWATGVLMVATVAALAASRLLFGRFSLRLLFTAAIVLVFGGLTIWLQDPRFVMLKPTIIYLIFAGVLGFGLVTRRPLLKPLVGEMLKLTDEGWHKLTIRWIGFFLAMALLNEFVWRNFSVQTWVTFKALGILLLTLLFAVFQVGLIKRHEAKDNDAAVS